MSVPLWLPAPLPLAPGGTASPPCRAASRPPSSLESLLKISYNTMDGLIDRQSFHGLYAVQDGLPL